LPSQWCLVGPGPAALDSALASAFPPSFTEITSRIFGIDPNISIIESDCRLSRQRRVPLKIVNVLDVDV
jgi:hypothetical protein